ncbi:MAG: O-antigen ligase family protein [Bacteroidales bacterium]
MLLYSLGIIAVAGWGLFQLWQYEWNLVVIPGIFRPFYKDHTILGASAAFLAVFWLSYSFLKGRKANTRIFSIVLGSFFVLLVLFSSSRAAFISLFISLFTGVLFLLRFRVRHILVMALTFLLTGLIFFEYIEDKLFSNLSESRNHYADYAEHIRSAGNVSTDVSNLERMNRWISAWRMFKNRPLTGYGPGTFQFAYIPFQEETLMTHLSVKDPYDIPEGSGGTAHSEYMLVLSEMGIFGLIAMLLFLGRILFLAFEKRHWDPGKPEIIIAFTALSSYLFHALFNNFLTTEKVAFLFWGMAAWLVANYYRDNEEKELLQAS